MISTLQDECAEHGKNYIEVLDQIALEEQDLKDRNLTRMSVVAAVQSVKGAKPDSADDDGGGAPASGSASNDDGQTEKDAA